MSCLKNQWHTGMRAKATSLPKGDFTARDKVIKVVAGMQAAASGEGSRPWARMAVFSAQS